MNRGFTLTETAPDGDDLLALVTFAIDHPNPGWSSEHTARRILQDVLTHVAKNVANAEPDEEYTHDGSPGRGIECICGEVDRTDQPCGVCVRRAALDSLHVSTPWPQIYAGRAS